MIEYAYVVVFEGINEYKHYNSITTVCLTKAQAISEVKKLTATLPKDSIGEYIYEEVRLTK